MDSPNAIFFWLGVEALVGLLWIFTMIRAYSKIQTHAFFGSERPLPRIEFWRYVFCSTLLFLTVAFILVIVSRYDVHHPIYRYPISIARLLVVNLVAGLMVGLCSWALIQAAVRQMAKFHHPDAATWKEFRFWGPKMRKMTAQERIVYLQKMGWSDYLETLRLCLTGFAFLPFPFFWMYLIMMPPEKDFVYVLGRFFKELLPAELILAILAFALVSFFWLWRRLCAWLGWARTLS